MYAAVGAVLAPRALVAVVSWRDPERDGLEWLVDLVLGGLRQGQASAEEGGGGAHGRTARVPMRGGFHWRLDVHSVVRGEGVTCGPHVYVLRRTPRRASERLRAQGSGASGASAGQAGEEEEEEEEELKMRHHLHAAE